MSENIGNSEKATSTGELGIQMSRVLWTVSETERVGLDRTTTSSHSLGTGVKVQHRVKSSAPQS